MATHALTTPTPRRELLGAAGAFLLLAAPAAGPAKAAELDGELLTLCGRFHAMWAEYERTADPADDDAMDEAIECESDLLKAIAVLPARSPEGLRAKARVILAFHGRIADDHRGLLPHERLEFSLYRDVAGEG